MKTFIKQIAEYIWEAHRSEFEELTIVFPNKRASYYFRNAISEFVEQPIFSPSLFSMEEYMQQYTSSIKIDRLELIKILFETFKEIQDSEETFDQFYFWGEMILNDFEEVDKYLVDPKQLFVNIKEEREIKDLYATFEEEQIHAIQRFWNVFWDQSQDKKAKFLKTWGILEPLYNAFNDKLKTYNYTTTAKIAKTICESIDQDTFISKAHRIIFCGFNALTTSEKKIIETHLKTGKAEMFWDYEDWMVNKKHQESGVFLREYKHLPLFKEQFANQEKKIKQAVIEKQVTVVESPTYNGQAKVLGAELKKLLNTPGVKQEDILIVLADESLLFSVLRVIPESVSDVNVSMGFPLQLTPLFGMIELLMKLQERKRVGKADEIYFHFEGLIKILEHAFLTNIWETDKKAIATLLKEIKGENRIYIKASDILEIKHPLVKLIFRPIGSVNKIPLYINEVLQKIVCYPFSDSALSMKPLEKQYFIYAIQQINKLDLFFGEWEQEEMNYKQLIRLFKHLIQSTQIPFTGNPLQGLQIMGVLETRNLDYKHLFVFNANEGSWPGNALKGSFIPYHLRKGFRVPSYEDQDAVYAYSFFRLLHRAQSATLIYNTVTDSIGKGERSRFITQLDLERRAHIKFKEFQYAIPSKVDAVKAVYGKLPPNNFLNLSKYIYDGEPYKEWESKLSPSALNIYLGCRFKFYLKYGLGIYKDNEIEEQAAVNFVGTILHETLDNVYKPFVNREVNKTHIEKMIKQLPNLVKKNFNEIFDNKDDIEMNGGNVLVQDIIVNMCKDVLVADKRATPFKLIDVEPVKIFNLPIFVNGKSIEIKIGGAIDRIDERDGVVHMLDYKTGKDNNEAKDIEDLFKPRKDRPKAAFQTFLYALMYYKNTKSTTRITSGIINTQKVFDESYDPYIKFGASKNDKIPMKEIPTQWMDDFEKGLTDLVEEIFDPHNEFNQTDDTIQCEYCDFKVLCRR